MTDSTCLRNKKVLVTGASGLIGRALTKKLLEVGAHVVALVRNESKAKKAFASLPQDNLELFVCDVRNLIPQNKDVAYIIHGANPTASKSFVDTPVEVVHAAVTGTENVLEFARVNPVESLVYLSTMEVYGAPEDDRKVTEETGTTLNPMCVRSCYPESKRLCECMCAAYAHEYAVPAKVLRLTQTFGTGVAYDDSRVFAEFARSVIEGRDIVLRTKGATKRNYLSVNDAVEAALTVLLLGTSGEAYNAANETTYCSIREMADMVAETFGAGKCKVVIDEPEDIGSFGYAPTLKMNLSAAKLKALGWRAKDSLADMFAAMIKDM